MTQRVAIFGSTGAQGGAVVEAALEAGLAVRAVARSEAKIMDRFGDRVEACAADLLNADDVAKAMTGVDAAFVHPPIPTDPSHPEQFIANIIAGAHRAKLPLLVFSTSGSTGDRYEQVPMIAGNTAMANAIRTCGVPAIVLMPTIYLENLQVPLFVPELMSKGVLDYPPLQPSQKLSWTSHKDQALIATAAFGRPDLAGQAYEIASETAVTGPELAALLQEALGKPVAFGPVTPDAFGQRVADALGAPPVAAALSSLYQAIGKLSDDGAVIDVKPVEAAFKIKLKSVAERIGEWPTP